MNYANNEAQLTVSKHVKEKPMLKKNIVNEKEKQMKTKKKN